MNSRHYAPAIPTSSCLRETRDERRTIKDTTAKVAVAVLIILHLFRQSVIPRRSVKVPLAGCNTSAVDAPGRSDHIPFMAHAEIECSGIAVLLGEMAYS